MSIKLTFRALALRQSDCFLQGKLISWTIKTEYKSLTYRLLTLQYSELISF